MKNFLLSKFCCRFEENLDVLDWPIVMEIFHFTQRILFKWPKIKFTFFIMTLEAFIKLTFPPTVASLHWIKLVCIWFFEFTQFNQLFFFSFFRCITIISTKGRIWLFRNTKGLFKPISRPLRTAETKSFWGRSVHFKTFRRSRNYVQCCASRYQLGRKTRTGKSGSWTQKVGFFFKIINSVAKL